MWLAALIMPRFEGVSATTTLWPMRRSPKPRAELRMLAIWPNMLLINVTLIDLSDMALTHEFRDALAALGRDVVRSAQFGERIHGRAHHIDGVARAVALREHVTHPGAFEHRAHAAAGDHAGTVGRRLHVHPRGPMPALDRVEQRVVLQRDRDQALAGLHHGLGNRERHFARLAVTEAAAAGAVAHDGKRGEAELLAALDPLGDTVHRDQLFEQVIPGHWFFYSRHSLMTLWLELETRFASGLCQRFDAPVIHETGTVEGDLRDAFRLGALRDGAAHGLGSLDVAGGFQRAAHVLLQGGRGDQNLVALGSKDLRIDVLGRPVHRQAQRGKLL